MHFMSWLRFNLMCLFCLLLCWIFQCYHTWRVLFVINPADMTLKRLAALCFIFLSFVSAIYKLLSYMCWLSNAFKGVQIPSGLPLKCFDAVMCANLVAALWCCHDLPCIKHMLKIVQACQSGVRFKCDQMQPCSHKDSVYPRLCLLEIALTEWIAQKSAEQ